MEKYDDIIKAKQNIYLNEMDYLPARNFEKKCKILQLTNEDPTPSNQMLSEIDWI